MGAGQIDRHVSPHIRSLITAYELCWCYKGNLKGNVKADSEVALQILTESSSQAGSNQQEPKSIQTRTVTGRVIAFWWWLSTDRVVTAVTTTLPVLPLYKKSQNNTRDRRTRSPKSRLGSCPFQLHLWGANAWKDMSRQFVQCALSWLCSLPSGLSHFFLELIS